MCPKRQAKGFGETTKTGRCAKDAVAPEIDLSHFAPIVSAGDIAVAEASRGQIAEKFTDAVQIFGKMFDKN